MNTKKLKMWLNEWLENISGIVWYIFKHDLVDLSYKNGHT